MKVVKIFSLLMVLIIAGTNTVFAQTEMTGEQKAEMKAKIQQQVADLSLTDEQIPQFKEISKKYAAKLQAMKEAGGGKMKMYKKYKAIRKEKNAEMELLLNDEQYEIYLEKQKDAEKQMKAKRKQ